MSTLSMTKLRPEDFLCYVENDVGELGGNSNEAIRLADHRILGTVAIRCFSLPEDMNEREILERKITEGLKTYQQASNEFLVRIHGYVKWSNSMGIVMEHMPAGSLAAFLTGASAPSPKVILKMATDISSGIACMYNLLPSNFFTRGNLKPKHILLTGDLHCKVAGFGIEELLALAEFIPKEIQTVSSTKVKEIDLPYFAPEQLKDIKVDVTKKQDTYGFGMLLDALITHSNSVTPLFMGIKSVEQGSRPTVAPIDELKQHLVDDDVKIIEILESVVHKCWRQNPADRPDMSDVRRELQDALYKQNANDLRKELRETFKNLPVSLPPSGEQDKCLLSAFSTEERKFVRVPGSSLNPTDRKTEVETNRSEAKQKSRDGKVELLESWAPMSVNPKIAEPIAKGVRSMVGANGEEMTIGGCKLVVPAGALIDSVEIFLTAQYHKQQDSEIKRLTPILKCEPHGLKFDKEIEIHLPTCFFTDGVNSVPAVLRWSEDGSQWKELKTIDHKAEKYFKFHVKHFSWYDVVLKSLEKFVGFLVEKRVECGFRMPCPRYRDDLQAKCSVADSIDLQRKEMEGFTKGYACYVSLKPNENYIDFQLQCGSIAADEEVKRMDDLRISAYREIPFRFLSRGETWDSKEFILTMKTLCRRISIKIYVPYSEPAKNRNVLINVQNANNSTIAGGSVINTVHNHLHTEPNRSSPAAKLPTTASSVSSSDESEENSGRNILIDSDRQKPNQKREFKTCGWRKRPETCSSWRDFATSSNLRKESTSQRDILLMNLCPLYLQLPDIED